MRINDRNLTGTTAAESSQTQKVDRFESGSAGRTAGNGGDRVELSSTLGRLSRALGAYQSDRATKVAALASQYQSGNYHADAAAVSHKMVAEAMDLRNQPR